MPASTTIDKSEKIDKSVTEINVVNYVEEASANSTLNIDEQFTQFKKIITSENIYDVLNELLVKKNINQILQQFEIGQLLQIFEIFIEKTKKITKEQDADCVIEKVRSTIIDEISKKAHKIDAATIYKTLMQAKSFNLLDVFNVMLLLRVRQIIKNKTESETENKTKNKILLDAVQHTLVRKLNLLGAEEIIDVVNKDASGFMMDNLTNNLLIKIFSIYQQSPNTNANGQNQLANNGQNFILKLKNIANTLSCKYIVEFLEFDKPTKILELLNIKKLTNILHYMYQNIKNDKVFDRLEAIRLKVQDQLVANLQKTSDIDLANWAIMAGSQLDLIKKNINIILSVWRGIEVKRKNIIEILENDEACGKLGKKNMKVVLDDLYVMEEIKCTLVEMIRSLCAHCSHDEFLVVLNDNIDFAELIVGSLNAFKLFKLFKFAVFVKSDSLKDISDERLLCLRKIVYNCILQTLAVISSNDIVHGIIHAQCFELLDYIDEQQMLKFIFKVAEDYEWENIYEACYEYAKAIFTIYYICRLPAKKGMQLIVDNDLFLVARHLSIPQALTIMYVIEKNENTHLTCSQYTKVYELKDAILSSLTTNSMLQMLAILESIKGDNEQDKNYKIICNMQSDIIIIKLLELEQATTATITPITSTIPTTLTTSITPTSAATTTVPTTSITPTSATTTVPTTSITPTSAATTTVPTTSITSALAVSSPSYSIS